MTNALDDLNAQIVRAENRAVGLSMTGGWTAEEDEALAALYERRRALFDERAAERAARRDADR